MSTPEIKVTTAWSAQGEGRDAYARLLTPELEVLIRNQNIETRDINSMKWPLFGLSRHAVCKLLMLRTDLLLLMSDTPGEIAEIENAYETLNEYRIWFRCTDDPADEGQIFTRMHIAKVTPLAVTGNGYVKKVPQLDENGDPVLDEFGNQIEDDVHEGEALYIVEFRCDRWWWSSFRRFTFSPWVASGTGSCGLGYPAQTPFHASWVESHNEGDVFGAGDADSMIEKLLKGKSAFGCGLGDGNQSESYGLFRESRQDEFEFISLLHPKLRATSGNFDRHRPIVEVIDEICRDCHLAISYRPSGSIANGYKGKYSFSIKSNASTASGTGLKEFIAAHGDNVIAGAIDTQSIVDTEFDDPAATYSSRWPRMINLAPITGSITSHHSFSIAHRASIPDGRPPSVFSAISAYGEANSSTGSFSTTKQYLPDPFSEFQPYDIVSLSFDNTTGLAYPFRPRFIALKKFPSAYIDLTSTSTVREWQARNRYQGQSLIYGQVGSSNWYHLNETGKIKPLSPIDLEQTFEEERTLYDDRRRSNTCDIWLNKWWMPASDEVWLGSAWIELRLQTDEDGFGFPTTRIWSDYEDPLFCSVADDKPLDIRATGLAKSWRDSDGKTRVHVAWPFGIPCLIKIIGLSTSVGTGGQFNPGVKAWAYEAKVVMKGQGGNDSSFPRRYPAIGGNPGEGLGQLIDFFGSGSANEDRLTAYNLAELANTTSFSAPGYKMPIAQQGFDVLPIGKDRDGNQHEVIVQAMVYWSDERDPANTAQSEAQRSRLPVAYFCLPNAIDGECPTPLTLDQSLDGGTY